MGFFLRLLFRKEAMVPLCLVMCLSAIAQDPACTLSISGQVIDEHDRTPLSFSEIFLPDLGTGAVADETGAYKIEGLCPGPLHIKVMHLGCEPVERRIDLRRDIVLNFMLEHHHEELRELEVIRERPDENVGHAREVLRRDELDLRAGSDMATMLGVIPGVNVLRTGPSIGKPLIHGHSGNRILIMQQGIRQEDQQWGTEHAPNIDPFSGDGLTVIKGAAAVQYGSDAIGGVVINEPVSLPREKGIAGDIHLSGSSNARGGMAAAMVQGGSGRWRGVGWRIQGSTQMHGDRHAPEYVLSNTGSREGGISGAIGFHGGRTGGSVYYSYYTREMGILRAAHIGNLTDLQRAIERRRPWHVAPFTYEIGAPRQLVSHHLVRTEIIHRVTDRNQLVFTHGYQVNDRQEFDIRRMSGDTRPSLDLFLPTHTADVVFKHWFGQRLHGKMGVSGIHQRNLNVPGTGIRPLIPNYIRRSAGVFILEHYPLTDHLELEAGARLEHAILQVYKYDQDGVWITPEHAFTNHALSTGANWTPQEDLTMRFNISTAYRPPHVSELYSEGLHHGSAAVERGDATLESERSLKTVADILAGSRNTRVKGGLTLYADRIFNYIYLRPAGQMLTIRGAFPVFDHVATDAFLHGMDATVEIVLGAGFSIQSRAGIVRGADLGTNGPLYLMPADRFENALIFRRDTLKNWRGLEVRLSSMVVLEQTRFPEDLDLMEPPGAYHLLGFSAAITRPIAGKEFRIGITGSNLLNSAYRDLLDRFRYYADAQGVNISASIRMTFGRSR